MKFRVAHSGNTTLFPGRETEPDHAGASLHPCTPVIETSREPPAKLNVIKPLEPKDDASTWAGQTGEHANDPWGGRNRKAETPTSTPNSHYDDTIQNNNRKSTP